MLHHTRTIPFAYEQNTDNIPHLFNSGSRKTITERSRHHAVKQAILMMRTYFHEPLTLQKIAASAQLSPFHFNRIFRSMTGIPPSVYLAALRIEQAKKLLLTTNRSVTCICFDVGYNSLGTFTTRFTQLVGMAPSHLRQVSQDETLCSYFQDWDGLQDTLSIIQHTSEKAVIEGNITTPASFDGLIFLGLFSDPIPQGRPISCTVLTKPGRYHLSAIPEGQYYLFATALRRSEDFTEMLEAKMSLRSSSQHSLYVTQGSVQKNLNLTLSPASWTDPPILIALPWLLISLITEYALDSNAIPEII